PRAPLFPYTTLFRSLGVEIEPRMMLPPDEQAHGFDTNADALSIQPALLDRYLSAAAKITRLAVGDPTIPPGFERYTALKAGRNRDRKSTRLNSGTGP